MKLKSVQEPHPFRVIYIDSSKRLNDYYALGRNTLKTTKVW
jgi:hypothetical protein